MGEGRALAEDGALPAELAATLEPQIQSALNHPARRQVMRILHSRSGPCTVAELHDKLPRLSRGGIGYHLQVLQDSGCVLEVGTRPGPLGRERELSSALLGDEDALRALDATQASDLKSVVGRPEHDR